MSSSLNISRYRRKEYGEQLREELREREQASPLRGLSRHRSSPGPHGAHGGVPFVPAGVSAVVRHGPHRTPRESPEALGPPSARRHAASGGGGTPACVRLLSVDIACLALVT